MPGTIQVSILELVGLPSLQQSSSMGIKVSMGKQIYNIQEKGDSSFVLVSLRDNLTVTVHDSEGNEIARTGVDSRSIVEKGMWDDIFPLQGGGHIHMKLHFILTEEEQKRIRSMRESAARKKQEDLLKRSRSSSDLAVSSGGSSALRGDLLKASQQVQAGNMNLAERRVMFPPPSCSAIVPSQIHPVQKKQTFSTSKSTGALDKLPGYQSVKKQIQHRDEEQRNQLEKTPKKVRNMILAFESSPVKEASPATSETRAAPDISPLKALKMTLPVNAKPVLFKLGAKPAPISEEHVIEREEATTDNSLKSPTKVSSKEMVTKREEIGECQETLCSTTARDSILPLKTPKKMILTAEKPVLSRAEVEDYVDHCQEILVQNMEQFKESEPQTVEKEVTEEIIIISPNKLYSGRSKFSWKTLPSRGLPQYFTDIPFVKKQISSSSDSSVFEKSSRSKHSKSCGNNGKSSSAGNSHGWIFVEENVHSCVPSNDKPFVDLLEGVFQVRDTDVVQDKGDERYVELRPFESGKRPESPDNKPHIRPVRQVVNIAIMVGFGLLVLVRRQRK